MSIDITTSGKCLRDSSGLHHHEPAPGVSIDDFAADVIEHPAPGPAWFWFNGTPAPIAPGDTINTLLKRWGHWRSVYQRNNPPEFMQLLENLPHMETK